MKTFVIIDVTIWSRSLRSNISLGTKTDCVPAQTTFGGICTFFQISFENMRELTRQYRPSSGRDNISPGWIYCFRNKLIKTCIGPAPKNTFIIVNGGRFGPKLFFVFFIFLFYVQIYIVSCLRLICGNRLRNYDVYVIAVRRRNTYWFLCAP